MVVVVLVAVAAVGPWYKVQVEVARSILQSGEHHKVSAEAFPVEQTVFVETVAAVVVVANKSLYSLQCKLVTYPR